MEENIKNTNLNDSDDFIDLKQVVRFLYHHKKFIFIITLSFALLAIVYSFLFLKSNYQAKVSFLPPDITSLTFIENINELISKKDKNRMFINTLTSSLIENINELTPKGDEQKYDLYEVFINKVISLEFQRKVFFEKGYDKILSSNIGKQDASTDYNNFINSIEFYQDKKKNLAKSMIIKLL